MKIKASKFNQKHSSKVLQGCVLDILEEVNTPKSLALAISYRYGEYKTLDLDLLSCDPNTYFNAMDYKRDSQAVALFKKSTYLEEQCDLEAESVANFLSLEKELAQFNSSSRTSYYNSIIFLSRRIMQNLLGPVPEMEELKVSFTSGATFSLRANKATMAVKLSSRLDVTTHAQPYLLRLLAANEKLFRAYQDKKIITVKGNSLSSVPKDFRKKRLICKEPLGNMLLQRSFGLHIKARLKRIGIYIETGQSDHRALLRHDSDAFSTIDQSDASDRISVALVRDILPLDWFHTLNRIRSRNTLIGDKWHELEKFMTQGNGFTFELETALFYCIAQAMHIYEHGRKTVVSVYGDDMIVPVHHGKCVVDNLNTFGLKVNTEKSYVDTAFKESCGFDILEGSEVRPYYLKEFEPNEIIFYYSLANFIKRVYDYLYFGNTYNLNDCRPWRRCLSGIKPDKPIFYGPCSLGDHVIHTHTKPDSCKTAYWKRGILYVTVIQRVFRRTSYSKPYGGQSELAYALLGGSSSGSLVRGADYTLRTALACPVNWA